MAQRKRDLVNKLSGSSESRPGWRETITLGGPTPSGGERRLPYPAAQPTPEPANKLKRKTYLLYAGMVDEIEQLAERERVGINELVRYLIGTALDQVYGGQLVIPTRPDKRRIEP